MGKIALVTDKVTVATAGIPSKLAAGTSPVYARNLRIRTLSTNTHAVYLAPVGTTPSTHGFELAAAAVSAHTTEWTSQPDEVIDINQLQIDVVTNGEGVTISYTPVQR